MSTPSTIVVDVTVHQNWYVATSRSLAGLFVADPTMFGLLQEIPEVIKMLIKTKYGKDVEVAEARELDSTDVFPITYAAITKCAA
ncbi:MAG TPA: hypothetical protein VHW09_27255 [Bryobacteraceae bacterium]|jgi:hypothetical protein|nr:hypothetical protein [Bryobacteraceae bacterium]